MEFVEQRQGAVSVIRPAGALTEIEREQFAGKIFAMIEASMGRVVLDASDIPYVDSAGLEALLDASDKLAESGRALKIAHVNETLRETFDLTEVRDAFECYEDTNAAVRSFL